MRHTCTGKILLQEALTNIFYEIGLHLLCLAPANSNVDDFTNRMAAALPDVGLRRVYQAKYEYGSKSMPSIKDVPANYNDINRKMNLGAEVRQHNSRLPYWRRPTRVRRSAVSRCIIGTVRSSVPPKMSTHARSYRGRFSALATITWDNDHDNRKFKQCYKYCYFLTKAISTSADSSSATSTVTLIRSP